MTKMADMAQQMQDGHRMGTMALGSLAQIEHLLTLLTMQDESDPAMLCVTDDEAPPQVLTKDFPYEGSVRAIVQRTPNAAKIPAVALASGLLFDSNVNRLGGFLVNKSTVGLTLFFCNETGPTAGDGSIWIPPNGNWDFKLGNILWCGHVFGVPDSLSVNVAACEI